MTVWAETMVHPAPLQSVIDWSMTVFAVTMAETMGHPAPLQTVIDRSMTFFRLGNGLSQKIVIDQSMTFFA